MPACRAKGCGCTFETEELLKAHIAEHHQKLHQCDQCDYTSKALGNFKRHILTHTSSRDFQCPECPHASQTKGDLAKHVATMHNSMSSRQFECEECGFKSATASNAKAHMLSHSDQRNFACTLCDKKCKTKGDLIKHVRQVHDESRPFQCDVDGCKYPGAKFAKDLETHLNGFHSNVSTLRCEEPGCDRIFKSAVGLSYHTKSHNGERPYKCTTCDYAAKSSSDLIRHVLTHNVNRKYMCKLSGCDYTSHQKGNYLSHCETFHYEYYGQLRKIEETKIANLFDAVGIVYHRETHIRFCESLDAGKFARLDFTIEDPSVVIIVSVDEFQHERYTLSCELTRVSNVQSAIYLSGDVRPIVWIRYNPNKFKIDGKTMQCVGRELELVSFIFGVKDKTALGQSYPPLSLVYMFYDCSNNDDGTVGLDITQDVEFDPTLKACITNIITERAKPSITKCVKTCSTVPQKRGFEEGVNKSVKCPPLKKLKRVLDLKCRFCDESCDQLATLRYHEQVNHKDLTSFTCFFGYCDFVGVSEKDYQVHLLGKHKVHKCDYCQYCSNQSTTIRTHMLKDHQTFLVHKCDNCSEMFESEDSLMKHGKTHETKQFKCDRCDYQATRKGNVVRHQGTPACEKRVVEMQQ